MSKIDIDAGKYRLIGESASGYPDAENIMSMLDLNMISREVDGENKLVLVKDFGQKRNKVILFQYNGKLYVGKQFKRPRRLNGFIRRWFSYSKAHNAYRNAFLLINNGFKTAVPVVWWERQEGLRITDSWIVTEYLEYNMIYEFRDIYHTAAQQQALMRALSGYMLKLHDSGFVPSDFNICNIFYSATSRFFDKEEMQTPEDIKEFYLIDINRMKFGKIPSFNQVMRSFDQLGILPEEYPYLLYPYADAKGWDREKCIHKIIYFRNRNSILGKMKLYLRKFHGKNCISDK